MSKGRRSILSALFEFTKPVTPREISEETGVGVKSIRGHLLGLTKTGYISREAKGLYSLTEKGRQEATRIKAVRDEAAKFLATIPRERGFHFYKAVGDYTGVTARSLHEFSEAVRTLEPKSIEFHLTRGDFENWVHDLGDHTLAQNLREIRESKLSTEELKNKLHIIVQTRVKALKEALT